MAGRTLRPPSGAPHVALVTLTSRDVYVKVPLPGMMHNFPFSLPFFGSPMSIIRLLCDIRLKKASLLLPTSLAVAQDLTRSIGNEKRRGNRLLVLDCNIMEGWDPGAQVQLAFAAEAAADAADAERTTSMEGLAALPPLVPQLVLSAAAVSLPLSSSMRVSSLAVEHVCLEDLGHIRTTLVRAELENLQFDDISIVIRPFTLLPLIFIFLYSYMLFV